MSVTESRFEEIKEKAIYEDQHYYIAQLYDLNWAPSTISL
jgi:hypothetical protein